MYTPYFLTLLACLFSMTRQSTSSEKPFTVQDFEKIKLSCDAMLEDIGTLYRAIIKTREELKNNPHKEVGLRGIAIKINEIEFLTLFNYYQQNCLKK